MSLELDKDDLEQLQWIRSNDEWHWSTEGHIELLLRAIDLLTEENHLLTEENQALVGGFRTAFGLPRTQPHRK